MKPITKQLIIAVFILTLVTALSFGIRRIRLGAYRADTGELIPSARPSDTEDKSQPEQSLNTDTEPDYYHDDSYTVDDEQDSQYADGSDWDEQAASDDYSEENTDSIKYDKSLLKTKSFKGGYAKSVGKNGPQQISLSDNENIYITEKGEAWYVSKGPGGDITKMQVQIDDYTGQITPVGGGEYAKTGGSQGPQRIPMGDNENIYLTEEGEAWYVSEQPDGSTAKVQLQPD
ncbi:MAG: hypothetical protein JSV16_06820 [Candidatus Hydrogenedentota bacterium]|nr:MAG: hypothetical protein JSV16_06820 [Candidatus Hydrogenedentota bacterium]